MTFEKALLNTLAGVIVGGFLGMLFIYLVIQGGGWLMDEIRWRWGRGKRGR